jgi:acetyltransferase-like isoleucine patch superfamily enzyme
MLRAYLKGVYDSYAQLTHRTLLSQRGLRCARNSQIQVKTIESIKSGRHCTLGNFSVLDVISQPGDLQDRAEIILGDNVYIGDQCNLRASGKPIKIGSDTLIANSTIIVSANHGVSLGTKISDQPWSKTGEGVTIGRDCWIGSNVTILPNSVIEDGCIIGAGSVVRGRIPAQTIWAGVPAKYIKNRV